MPTETQITTAPHGHILTNTAVWSPDSQWIVYDVRSDPAGSVFDGTRIERVNVKTKQVEVLYESKNGACVGVATVNPVDGRVVFIHGPENPTPDWSYSACHREGVIVDPAKPGVAVALEARDVVPPFTFGALRGGTHVHTWDSAGVRVSYTYEDHVLTHGTAQYKEPNRRTVGISVPYSSVTVPITHFRNRGSEFFSSIPVMTWARPKPGSDQIGRAFEDGWVPGQMAMTFVGEVLAEDGRRVNELFVLDWLEPRVHRWNYNRGTETTMPESTSESRQSRLTRFAEVPGHTGLTTSPRHWPRASPDGKRIAYLTENGQLHLFATPPVIIDVNASVRIKQRPKGKGPFPSGFEFDPDNPGQFLKTANAPYDIENDVWETSRTPIAMPGRENLARSVSSAFTWHPNSKHLAAVVDKSVCLIDMDSGKVFPLTSPSDPPPRPEACVVSPDGTKVAFVRPVGGFNQVFVVDTPPSLEGRGPGG
jgi:hypothetical protein